MLNPTTAAHVPSTPCTVPLPCTRSGLPGATSAAYAVQPNKRSKLTGGDRLKGSGVLCPWRGTDCRPPPLRRRASRPQLKRDPLGGTRYDTSSVLDRRVTMARRSRLNVTLWILAAALPLHAACSRQEPRDQKVVTAAINDVWSRYTSSLNSGDIDGWMSLWADSGVQM